MPLKKPSEFYEKNPNSSFDDVKEELKNAKPEKVERISEAFDSFKSNLNNIQSLSDFTETFNTFKSNVEKVEGLSNTVEEIRENIQDLISKKDLDDSMMAHLLFVEESIRNVQDKVKTVNSNTLFEVKEEFNTLCEKVNSMKDYLRFLYYQNHHYLNPNPDPLQQLNQKLFLQTRMKRFQDLLKFYLLLFSLHSSFQK